MIENSFQVNDKGLEKCKDDKMRLDFIRIFSTMEEFLVVYLSDDLKFCRSIRKGPDMGLS